MLFTIQLNNDLTGHIVELASDVDRRKIDKANALFTGLIPVALRNKAGKVANNYLLKHTPCEKESFNRELTVIANGNSQPSAVIKINLSTGQYTATVAPFERKKGLTAEFEISIQPARKLKEV